MGIRLFQHLDEKATNKINHCNGIKKQRQHKYLVEIKIFILSIPSRSTNSHGLVTRNISIVKVITKASIREGYHKLMDIRKGHHRFSGNL